MDFLRDVLIFILMMLGIVGWFIVGVVALIVSPFVIGMILIGAVIFAPDMEGY